MFGPQNWSPPPYGDVSVTRYGRRARKLSKTKSSSVVPEAPFAPPPPEGTLYGTCAQVADSTKRRKKMGSSVAYKTIGTFLSQKMRLEDACGWATDRCKAVEMQRYANGRR